MRRHRAQLRPSWPSIMIPTWVIRLRSYAVSGFGPGERRHRGLDRVRAYTDIAENARGNSVALAGERGEDVGGGHPRRAHRSADGEGDLNHLFHPSGGHHHPPALRFATAQQFVDVRAHGLVADAESRKNATGVESGVSERGQ